MERNRKKGYENLCKSEIGNSEFSLCIFSHLIDILFNLLLSAFKIPGHPSSFGSTDIVHIHSHSKEKKTGLNLSKSKSLKQVKSNISCTLSHISATGM